MGLGIGGTVVAKARAVLEADTRGLDRGLDKSEKRFQKYNKVATKAALGVGVAMALGAKSAIEAASDLHEEMNKTDEVFGRSAKSVEKWSEDSAHAFGASRVEALRYVGSLGALLRPMGLTEKAASKMSKKLVETGGDLASFYNADTGDALKALQAGLVGQVRPLRQFGVFLSKDRVAAEALTSGLVKADVNLGKVKDAQEKVTLATMRVAEETKKHGKGSEEAQKAVLSLHSAERALKKELDGHVPTLNAAQKAQAAYKIILHDTKIAQGDFARTSDGAANRQRILAAETENMKEKLGQGLLPTYQKVLGLLIRLMDLLGRHTKATKILIGVIAGLAAGVLVVNAGYKVYIAMTRLAAVATLGMAETATVADKIMRLTIIGALIGLGIAIVVAYQKSEKFRNVVNAVMRAVRDVTVDAVEVILTIFDKWLGMYQEIFHVAGKLPGKLGAPFRAAESAIGKARDRVHELKDGIEHLKGKKVKVDVDLKVHAPAGARGPVGANGDGLLGAIRQSANAMSYGPAAGAGLAPRRDVSPGLWDELAIAEMGGLGISSTYRPGAITSTGNPSLHGLFPSHAFDATDGTSSGFASPRMRAVFNAVIGRPGISEVILSPYWWHPGAGIGRITEPSIMREHYSHVHVGSRKGDGLVGAKGDGLVGARKRKRRVKLPKSPRALRRRFSAKLTGEKGIDTLIGRIGRFERQRDRLQSEYQTREDEFGSDDTDLTHTETRTDPVTGEKYEVEVVDQGAVTREAGEAQNLIDLHGEIMAKTAAIRDLAATIVKKVRAAIKRVQAGIATASGAISKSSGRLSNLRKALAAEQKKRHPSKSRVKSLQGQIDAEENRLQGFVGAREDLRGRKKTLGEAIGEYDQKAFDEGQEYRRQGAFLSDLQKKKAEILGTKADDSGAPSGGGGGITPEEIAAQLAAQREAVIGARSRFLSDFASNIYHESGGMNVYGSQGPGGGRSVTVVQNFTQQPDDPFVWLRKSQFAAEGAFG